MLLVTRYDTWSFFPFSVFSRSAKLGKEGSRVSGVVMTRLWGRAADYPVRHIKFSFPFFKRRQGGGEEPCLARRNGRNSFVPKAWEGGKATAQWAVSCWGTHAWGSPFLCLAKCSRERSRVSGAVMTRLLSAPPVFHAKSPFRSENRKGLMRKARDRITRSLFQTAETEAAGRSGQRKVSCIPCRLPG